MMFAEFERLRMGERRAEAAEKMRATGQWNGGTPAYGYMAKEGADGLCQDPDTAPVVRRIVNEAIDGLPVKTICETLAAEGVPTMRGATAWRGSAVRRLLMSRALRGEIQHQRHPVLDNDGNPVKFTDDPIITESEWALLSDALNLRARPYGAYPGTHMLTRILYCGECDAPLYHQHNGRNDYYRCPGKHGAPAVRADKAEAFAETMLLTGYGAVEIERRVSTGKDYASELRLVEGELVEVENSYMAHNLSIERFERMTAKLEARRDEIKRLMADAVSEQWETTRETVAERWERRGVEGRNLTLASIGARIIHVRDPHAMTGGWDLELTFLPWNQAHERLARGGVV